MIFDSELYITLAAPDIIDEVSATEYYLGWFSPGGSESTASCRIVHMQKTGNIWRRHYAEGTDQKVHTWDDRTTYSYDYKK